MAFRALRTAQNSMQQLLSHPPTSVRGDVSSLVGCRSKWTSDEGRGPDDHQGPAYEAARPEDVKEDPTKTKVDLTENKMNLTEKKMDPTEMKRDLTEKEKAWKIVEERHSKLNDIFDPTVIYYVQPVGAYTMPLPIVFSQGFAWCDTPRIKDA